MHSRLPLFGVDAAIPQLTTTAVAESSTAVPETATTAPSPSSHPFMRRVKNSRYAFDPYKAAHRSPRSCPHHHSQSPAGSSPTPSSSSACAGSQSSISYEVGVTAPNEAICVDTMASSLPNKEAVTPSHFEVKQASNREAAALDAIVLPNPVPRYATVSFKHSSSTFRAPFKISIGDVVVVEGDRGDHIGVVKAITTERPQTEVLAKIIRRANEADKAACAEKLEKEVAATATIAKIAKDVRLSATVVDVEYQLDMNKLTIFVERPSATAFVDFRKLQRTVFREFRCRIWCVYMDEAVGDGSVPPPRLRAKLSSSSELARSYNDSTDSVLPSGTDSLASSAVHAHRKSI